MAKPFIVGTQFPAFTLVYLALCAAAIFPRAAAESVRFSTDRRSGACGLRPTQIGPGVPPGTSNEWKVSLQAPENPDQTFGGVSYLRRKKCPTCERLFTMLNTSQCNSSSGSTHLQLSAEPIFVGAGAMKAGGQRILLFL